MAEVGSTANRYQILAKLAAGGMAEIFLARGASVGGVERYCVLKRILRERAKDAQFVQMFVDEARLAAQLHHPNIASVYDIGIVGDSYFFTMEYVHGETIRSLLERAYELRRPVPLACVLTIIAGAAAGLHHAHERNASDGRPLGIVHRDVSPANLMVSYEGNVKLVDFGVAKAADRAVETRSGTVKGKISYLSPEQCRGARVDRRSDLFSLGIVMWEMLTGGRLYRRDSDYDNMTAIVNEPPPAPSARRSEVPRAVDAIVLRLLAKAVDDRFQTADDVVEAIENASMNARTILSTSAVSRLVRDLFGHRAEPWLEFDGDTIRNDPVTRGSRPLADALDAGPLDMVELEFASVLDLSVSLELEDADDTAGPSPASAPIAVRAAPSAPIAMPVAPSALNATAATTPAPPSWNTTLRDATPPSSWNTTLRDATPPTPPNTTLLGVSAPPSTSAPPSGPFPIATWLPAQIAPSARGGYAAASNPVVAELPAASPEPPPVLGSSPRLVPYQPGFAGSSQTTTQARSYQPPAPRVGWPLVAVIVVAAALGVIVAWVAMRTDSARPPKPAGGAPRSSLSTTEAGRLDARDAPPSVPPATAVAADLLDAGADADATAARDEPSPAAPTAVLEPAAAPSDARLPAPRPAPVKPASPAPASKAAAEALLDSLHTLSERNDHAGVVRACTQTTVTVAIASVCMLAACHVHDAARAQRWLLIHPAEVREKLAAYCKQLGNSEIKT